MEGFEGRFFEQLLGQSIAADLSGLSRDESMSGPPLLRGLAAFSQQDEHLRRELMASDGIGEVLQLCIETARDFPGISWGAGYVVDEETSALDLVASVHVPDAVLPTIQHYPSGAHMSLHVRAGRPLYLVRTGGDIGAEVASMSILPIVNNGRSVACLTVASDGNSAIPQRTRQFLEGISDYAGIVIARIIAEEKTKRVQDNQEEMLTSLVHSLKTPLAIMHGYIDLLLSRGEGGEHSLDQEWMLRKVMTQSERVSELITDLLDLEEVASDELLADSDTFSVGDIVDQVVGRLDDEAKGRIVLELPAGDLMVEVEQSWLAHAIEHVIVNAIRFSSSPVLVQIHGTKTEAIIDVVDHGVGILPEALPHIFERFYHASYLLSGRPNPGVGLGLTLASRIIKRFHGSISVTSTPGRGSRFSILLPQVSSM